MFLFSSYCHSDTILTEKTAIITGGNSGIGKEVARDFYNRGARVLLLCRNTSKAEQVAKKIKENGNGEKTSISGEIITKFLDLSSQSSIRRCAEDILTTEKNIDIFVINAGILTNEKIITEDGFESMFAVNYLGHFLLTMLLLPRIIESGPARIINNNSVAYSFESMNFEDLNYKIRTFEPFKAYCQTKLALMLFSNELARRLKDAGSRVTTYSVHPGLVNTKMSKNLGLYKSILKFPPIKNSMGYFMKTTKQGAQTIIHCAVDEKVKNDTGGYYVECKKTPMHPKAKDENTAKKLWDISLRLTKLGLDYDPFEFKI